jgi:Domain of unknown function (DUF4797)
MGFLDTPLSQSVSSSPAREKNLGLFNTLCKKFTKRSNSGLLYCNESIENQTDFCQNSGSSSNSCSSSDEKLSRYKKDCHASNLELSYSSIDSNNSSEDTVNTIQSEKNNRNSKTNEKHNTKLSIRRAFKSLSLLSLTNKSSSCDGTPAKSSPSMASSRSKKKEVFPPKRILRQPIQYTYRKGISGLPTQRVPRSAICCSYAR